MRLFLASEGCHPQTIEKLRLFADKPLEELSMVYVVTASNGIYSGSWKEDNDYQTVSPLFKHSQVLQFEDYYINDVIHEIEKVDVLWMAGGMSGYLMYWIRRIGLDHELPKILQNTLYVGSSAGSVICGPTQESADWYFQEPEPGARYLKGLGLVPFEIYPHFTENEYNAIDNRWNSGELWLLKDGDVITVDNGEVNVLGEKNVISK